MIIASGLVTLLTIALESASPHHLKNVAKCAIMIDSIIYSFPPSLNVFIAASGVEKTIARIASEIDVCITLESQFTPAELDPLKLLDPGASEKDRLLFSRTPLLRALMKLILHLMQSSGSADGMRNLIDSSLVKRIHAILVHSELFGHVGAFGLAVNIMSTFIHNEPTSLSILQEAGLPLAFLEAANKPLPVSAEVVSALPNAFGALCLNSVGLDQFVTCNPMDVYLDTFLNEAHLRSLLDNDVPHLIGNSIDEFMRHHPSLKESVMKSILKLLSKLVDIGKAMHSTSTSLQVGPLVPVDEKMSVLIDVISRFMEGLFQNTAHAKEFIKGGGIGMLMSIYALKSIPFDFAESNSSFSMSYLFRIIVESSAAEAITALTTALNSAIVVLEPLQTPGTLVKYVKMEGVDVEEARNVFSGLVNVKCLVRLMSDLYCSHSLSHTKSINSIILTFGGVNSDLLCKFGALKRY